MELYSDNKIQIFDVLNRILELEMAGVVRYTHYSLMIIGHGRIPIVSWMRSQAQESLNHATQAGEMITHFGQHPSLKIATLTETHKHNIDEILKESLEHEHLALKLYRELLKLSEGQSILLEEYARGLIVEEETHIGEVEKMLKKPV
ncbi:ferritin-like domain-containing protein [Fastidiosibacter lacustris]|uniref:ferritin-like domain-containing protein n=1 Tax=Fastidiosibacter lacustris TaxID=2056695 RepID=UPI000E351B24|nr:ferritin-like domain-containing protein [Fastidiosibacter lacustris]